MSPRAVIADDEPYLADDLRRRLDRLWPELAIEAVAHDGVEALHAIDRVQPDIAFLDIRMPGLTGMQVAGRLPGHCRLVFVTAYDDYAVAAFEQSAVDYLLKPVSDERLAHAVARVKQRLAEPASASELRRLLEQLDRHDAEARPLAWLNVSVGERVHLLPVDEVLYFAAEAKYTSVVTAGKEYVIRTPVKELEHSLDPDRFWRIHRATLVNVGAIDSVTRDFRGRLNVTLKGRDEILVVSRRYAHRFKQM